MIIRKEKKCGVSILMPEKHLSYWSIQAGVSEMWPWQMVSSTLISNEIQRL